MFNYISPNDERVVSQCDSDSIQNAINIAKETGVNKVIIPRKNLRTGETIWRITKTILLPSNIEIILSNCHLRLEDGVFCNIFRNENMYSSISKTLAGEQHDIYIRGEGYAVLDGGKTNFLLETNTKEMFQNNKTLKLSASHPTESIRINNLILFHNVKGFAVENIEVREQRWWALNFIYCSYGKIADITSRARNNIPNQDCVDIRQGCNNIVIERITGQSGDDLVALTALDTSDSNFAVQGKSANVFNITITDILGTSVRQGVVVLRNQDDIELHDISIENVIQSDLGDKNNLPYVTMRIGENGYFKHHQSTMGATRNIKVRNVISGSDTAVMVGATLKDVEFENIQAIGSRWAFLSYGVKMKDVKINGLSYSLPYTKAESPNGGFMETNHFAFNGWMRKDDYIENLSITSLQSETKEELRIDKDIPNEIYLDGVKV